MTRRKLERSLFQDNFSILTRLWKNTSYLKRMTILLNTLHILKAYRISLGPPGSKNIQAKLILPKLNDRSRSLLTKIPKEYLDDYRQMKDYLLREFKLTAKQCRDSLWSATKRPEANYKLFGARVKTVFLYHLDNRKAKSRDDVVDLLVADRVKQTLSESRLRHVLSDEGTDWFKPDKLVDVIDTYVNSRLCMPRDVGRSDATTASLVTNVGNDKVSME